MTSTVVAVPPAAVSLDVGAGAARSVDADALHALARRAMVDNQLRTNDVTEPALVAALRDVPREAFLPAALHAYVLVWHGDIPGWARGRACAQWPRTPASVRGWGGAAVGRPEQVAGLCTASTRPAPCGCGASVGSV